MNLYLTGMMGCGKTSIGRLLAKKRSCSFVDLDVLIEQNCQRSIADIFSQEGEEAFRTYETEALQEASEKDNQVIATGGGIILRDCNIATMKESGYIIFVDRPIHAIEKDIRLGHRPVVKAGIEQVHRVYRERIDRYCSTCDLRFYNRYKNRHQAAAVLQVLLIRKFDKPVQAKRIQVSGKIKRRNQQRNNKK